MSENAPDLVLTRVIYAPRELVFAAWTDAKHLAEWWGPGCFTNPVCEIDARPGGALLIHMRAPDGAVYPMTGTFREVVVPERLVFSSSALDGELQVLNTIIFEEQGSKTKLTKRAHVVKATAAAAGALAGMEQGWSQTLDRLDEVTAGRAFTITRVFNAPRALVFAAWTELDRLKQWWGPKGFTMLSATLDLRPGGVFHYGMRAPNGAEMWGKFIYREIVPPERLVTVTSFSDAHGGITRHPFSADWPREVLTTSTFTEREGKTTLIMRGFPINVTEIERKTFDAGRSSMQQGFAGTFAQLDEYLARN